MSAPKILPILIAILLASCEMESTGNVDISYKTLDTVEARERSIAALESGFHEVLVRRVIRVPNQCTTLEADLARAGNHLTLRITAVSADDECTQGEAVYAYEAVLKDLRSGRYELQVVHRLAESPVQAKVVLEHPIVVLDEPLNQP